MSVSENIEAYRNGDHVNAWRQLASLKLSELSSGDYERVVRLVRDVTKVIEDDLTTLCERLGSRGYRFKYGNDVVVASNEETRLQLEEVEERIGKVPLVLKCFYERFHYVDFSQQAEQRFDSKSEFHDFQSYISLIVASPAHALDRWEYTNKLSRDPEYLRNLGRTEPYPVERYVETGPVLGSGEPVGFYVPSDAADSRYYEDLVTGKPVLFLDDLRKSVKTAGFGGFAGLPMDDPKRVLATELSQGLKPF